MLDPGRYFAEAIYFLQYTLARILWAIDRALLSMAVIAESVNSWLTENVGYFVQLLVNALSAPLGGIFILSLTALGFWYALNNVVPTGRWVDPGKLFTYGLIAFFFFSSPIVVIDMMEELRLALNAGVDQALLDGAAGDIFDVGMDGTDAGLPAAIPDVNGDGVIGSFDLVAAFLLVGNLDELDNNEFPADFEAAYFPFGDPSTINLSDEADRQLAKALASQGIERLFFALVAIPTAIAEHFLRLVLTAVAVFLYLGVPLAMLLAFFVYTQAFLGAYLRQFVNLLVETLMSVIISAVMILLLAAAAQQGSGLYIAAGIIACIVLLWRVKSAMRLATAAFNLFGGGVVTGGEGGMGMVTMGKQALMGAAGLTAAALTGGASLAAGGTMLAGAAAVQADGRGEGNYLGLDPAKAEGRARQLKTMAGYALGKSETTRHLIEGAHEVRTLARNFRDGEPRHQAANSLDYLRAGSSLSGFGSSPWLAMRLSPSLRTAYDEIGGRAHRNGFQGLDEAYDAQGEPVSGRTGLGGRTEPDGRNRQDEGSWRDRAATAGQRAYLRRLGQEPPAELRRGEASDRIEAALGQNDLTARLQRRFGNEEGAEDPGAPNHETWGPGRTPVRASTPAPETVPDWLREPVVWPGEETNGHQAPPATATATVPAAGRDTSPQPDAGEGATLVPGRVRLEPHGETRQELLLANLEQLSEPASRAAAAAYEMLETYTGPRNAALIQAAVREHGVAAAQVATEAVAAAAAHFGEQSAPDGAARDDAAVLTAFQSGEAITAIRSTLASPLNDEQLAAVADMVLLPERRLTREELVEVIGRQVAAGHESEQAVSAALGMPIGFGGQTGNVRGVMAGAQAMRLAPEELARLAQLIRQGLRDEAQAELTGRGYAPETVRDFVTDLAALPGAMAVPQTTARKDEG